MIDDRIAVRLMWLVVLVAVLMHAGDVSTSWNQVQRSGGARDFASYWHAARVAADGGDPYDIRALRRSAKREQARGAVHPFLYPPPFVVAMGPLASMDLLDAYRWWFWLCELALVLTVLVLSVWWAPLHRLAPAVLAVLVAVMTPFPNNLVMGQANLPVLLTVVVGLAWMARERPVGAGMFIGIAAMAKMSPALFVLWWCVTGRWRAVGAAVATAVGLTLASLPWVGPEIQWRFYTEVLPQFASGEYNGLRVPIGLFGNHSVPNVLHLAFPSEGTGLSELARWGSRVVGVGVLVGTAVGLRRTKGPWGHGQRFAVLGVVMLLLPVYTYEHHLIWAWPAAALAILALLDRRLHPAVALLVVPAIVALCWELQMLKRWAGTTDLGWLLRESKFIALWGLGGAALAISSRPLPSASPPPEP